MVSCYRALSKDCLCRPKQPSTRIILRFGVRTNWSYMRLLKKSLAAISPLSSILAPQRVITPVALLTAIPSVQVTAFEAVVRGRYLLQGTVDRNGLSGRVIVKGFCDSDELDICLSAARGSVLVVCDAEGYEYELLDPERVMRLGRAAILVEVHDFAMDGLSELLKQRFSKSHIIEEVHPGPRRREDFHIEVAGVRVIPGRVMESFTSDNRPQDNFWLWMLPSQMHSLATG